MQIGLKESIQENLPAKPPRNDGPSSDRNAEALPKKWQQAGRRILQVSALRFSYPITNIAAFANVEHLRLIVDICSNSDQSGIQQ